MTQPNQQCEDCLTEQLDCTAPFCTANVEGALENNVVGLVDDVDNEQLCESSCRMEEDCNVYTYHQPNSTLFPSACFLLTQLVDPIREPTLMTSDPYPCSEFGN